jgi:hypothetical protein
MSYEITNSIRSRSMVRITGNTAVRINLSSLSSNTTNETIVSADIAQASGVTDGIWRIYRGNDATGQLVLELPDFSHYQFYEFDCSVANNNTSNVYVTNSGTAGTLILQLSKQATYTYDPFTGQPIR